VLHSYRLSAHQRTAKWLHRPGLGSNKLWVLMDQLNALKPNSVDEIQKVLFLGKMPSYHRVHILLQEGNPISLVFQNIDPPSPSPPGESVLPPQQRRGARGHTLAGRRVGWGVNILEDVRNRIALLQ
jgi:hypothetical protein